MKPATSAPTLRSIEDLPGPRGWPLVGSLLKVKLSRIHQDMEAWSRVYGPLFHVRLGTTAVLVVADHDMILAILRARPHVFQRSSKLRKVAEEMGAMPGLFTSEGEAWHRQRRMVMASFAPAHVRAYFAFLLKVTQRLHARWHQAMIDAAAIDLRADLKRFTVDVIAGLAFGAEVNSLESGEDPIHRHLDIIFAATFRRVMSPVAYWRYVKLPADRQLERSVAALNAAIEDFIARARARMQADPGLRQNPRNLLEAMIAAADQSGGAVDDRDVLGNVSTILLAGEDTTANTLAWLVYLLYRNPHVLNRAQDEVRRLAPELAALTPELLDRLEYLEACITEAMRLKPVAPFLGVETLSDTTVADVQVPAGTLVWCVMRHDSVDERYFHNADAFEPARWLNGGDKRVAMPFGAGPRICPGRYLASLEMKMAMAMLLGNFEIESVATPNGREAQELMSFTMNPVALQMRLRDAQL